MKPAHIGIPARAHSIPDDRNRPAEVFLLRDHARARRPAPRLPLPASRSLRLPSLRVAAVPLRLPSLRVAAVPLRHAAAVLPGWRGVSAAAWLPASDATLSGIRVLGNSVGCAAGPEISGRNLCAGKFATSAAGLWHAHRLDWYAGCVPWEVMTPLGPLGEDDVILPGHSALDSLSRSVAIARQRGNRSPRRSEEKTRLTRQAVTNRQALPLRRKQGRRHSRNALDLKETQEGNCGPK